MLLPPVELGLGALVLSGIAIVPAVILTCVLLFAFVVAAMWADERLDNGCGCFGTRSYVRSRRALILHDAGLLALGAIVLLTDASSPARDTSPVLITLGVLLLVAIELDDRLRLRRHRPQPG